MVVLGVNDAPYTPLQHLQHLVAACRGDLRCLILIATTSSDMNTAQFRLAAAGAITMTPS